MAHVWLARLDQLPADLNGLISPEEQARSARLIDREAGARWARGRGLLRKLLGSYLDRDPSALALTTGPHGKPRLYPPSVRAEEEAESDQPRLAFNLSHSGSLALLAFSSSSEVGVDVELARPKLDVLAVARRAFGVQAAARLAELEPAERQQSFLEAWVRHEAVIKWRGDAERVEAAGGSSEPWLVKLDPGPDGAGALALDRPPTALCCWRVER